MNPIYRGILPPKNKTVFWMKGKKLLVYTPTGWKETSADIIIDDSMVEGSENPVESKVIQQSLNAKQQALSLAISQKQNTLTIDTALSKTSENPIENKAVYNQYMTTDDTNEILVKIDPSYNREIFKKKYFTLEFITSGRFHLEGTVYYMSKNDEDWQMRRAYNYQNVSAGDVIKLKASGDIQNIKLKVETAQFNAYGNILSLFYGDDFLNYDSLPVSRTSSYRACNEMFENSEIISAENLILPETVQDYCYSNMFSGCTKLEKGPDLLATTLKQYCYLSMFEGCTKLEHIPKMGIIETVANRCCHSMFKSCTSLVDAPTLAATILVASCYEGMFMFCDSLKTAPNLPATTLASSCYANMFQDCTSLINIPNILPAETLESYCYQNMFLRCSSITESPVLPAASINKTYCYEQMFAGCSSLSKITCLGNPYAYSTSEVSNWVNGVSATGTFVKSTSALNWQNGKNGIPTGWTIQNI